MNEPRPWAIKSARLFDGTGAPPVEDAVALVEGERVSAVGPASDVAIPHDAEVLDAGDATLLPGLIDAHVHMLHTGSASSGVDSRAMNDRQLLLVGARNSLAALKSGLTTVRDCGDHDYMTLTLRDSITAGVLPGPRMLCSGPVITSTAGQLWWTGIECDTPDELRRAVRTLAKNGVDFIKLMGSGGNATPGSNPEVSQFDEEGYRAVADDAHRLGKRVAVHVHGVDAIRMAVDAGNGHTGALPVPRKRRHRIRRRAGGGHTAQGHHRQHRHARHLVQASGRGHARRAGAPGSPVGEPA